jgi:beta-glucosidase
VPRPVKELAGFRKVWLEAGEERRVSMSLAPRAFQFYDVDSGAFTYRPGEFEVLVGPNAAEVPLRRTFLVK